MCPLQSRYLKASRVASAPGAFIVDADKEKEMNQKALDPSTVPTSHPAGFYFIFWGEFAERCSYYGMRAILFLYLTTVLAFADDIAATWVFSFKAACYFLPLLGGFLADRYFGKYWTIVGFSVPYVLGHFVLGIQNEIALVIALALLAGGSGVIKPNISTLMGLTYDEKRPGQTALRSSAFLWFYFSINVGAMISQFGLPILRTRLIDLYSDPGWAYQITFQVPAWLMVAALGFFAAGKRFYAHEVIDRTQRSTPEERRQRWAALTTLFGIFGLMVFFWVAYEQNDNLWVAFARDHIALDGTNCELNLGFKTFTFSPDGFQYINSMFILILVPLFGWMWRNVDPQGTRFKPATKIFLGFLCTAVTISAMSLAAYLASIGVTLVDKNEIRAVIIKVDGDKVTFAEAKGKGEKGPEQTLPVADNVKIVKGRFNKDTKKVEAGDAIEDALKNKIFSSIGENGVRGVIVTDSDNKKITEIRLGHGELVTAWWMVLGYFLLTVSEILVYGTGLELAYTAAPANMKGFITACFLVTIAMGDLLNIPLAPLYKKEIQEWKFFALTAGIVLAASIAFYFVGRRFNRSSSQAATAE
jgi:POT family proton-dependent oligopeptide transporter